MSCPDITFDLNITCGDLPQKVRSLSEILIEADKTESLYELIERWNEIVKNKYQYPLVELQFAQEHLEELSAKLAKQDLKQITWTINS